MDKNLITNIGIWYTLAISLKKSEVFHSLTGINYPDLTWEGSGEISAARITILGSNGIPTGTS